MELYINGHKAEIKKEQELNISLQNNSFGNFNYIFFNYIDNIKLFKTPQNKKIFDLLGVIGNNSFAGQTKHDVFLREKNINIKGFGKIIRSTDEYYEFVIYFGGVDFYKLLKDKTLQDLDLSEYDHFRYPDSIIDSFQNKNTDGYITH